MALFDTDILIDHLRGREEARKVLMSFGEEVNYFSVITSGEILFGMRNSEREETLGLLNSLEELPVNKEIVRLAHDVKTRQRVSN